MTRTGQVINFIPDCTVEGPFKATIDKLTQELLKTQTLTKQQNDEKAKVLSDLESLQKENDKLRDELDSVKIDRSRIDKELKQLKNELNNTEHKTKTIETRFSDKIKRLEEKLVHANACMDKARTKWEKKFAETTERYNAEINSLRSKTFIFSDTASLSLHPISSANSYK